MSIDSKYAPIGYRAVECTREGGCNGCAFYPEKHEKGFEVCRSREPSCFMSRRPDAHTVIFVKDKVVDPLEAPEGYIAIDGGEFCDRCAFANQNCIDKKCLSSQRNDGCDVIFVKASTPIVPKVESKVIDPTEAPIGYVAVSYRSGCKGCDLFGQEGNVPCKHQVGCASGRSVRCTSSGRKDGCSVIFIRKEEPAKPSHPTIEINERVQRDLWRAIMNGIPIAKGNTDDEVARYRVALKILDGVKGVLKIE